MPYDVMLSLTIVCSCGFDVVNESRDLGQPDATRYHVHASTSSVNPFPGRKKVRVATNLAAEQQGFIN
jgi:hypothetical protein